MSNRVKGFVVTLKDDINAEDAETVQQVILLLRGVISVQPKEANFEDHINRQRIKMELAEKLWEVLK